MSQTLNYNTMTPADFAAVSEALTQGSLVCLPTDTVYGIACLPARSAAVKRVYEVKGRGFDKPLSLVFHDTEQIYRLIPSLPPLLREALDALMPGPVTAIIPVYGGELSGMGLLRGNSAGIRVIPPPPGELYRQLPAPLALTSANLSGRPDPVTAGEIPASVTAACEYVIDAGPGTASLPSTIIDLRPLAGDGRPRLMREGALGRAAVEELIGELDKPPEEQERELPPWLKK